MELAFPNELVELRMLVAKQQAALALQRPSEPEEEDYVPPESLHEPWRVLLLSLFPPTGVMGWQHWNHDPGMAVCYSLTFGLGGFWWVYDAFYLLFGGGEKPNHAWFFLRWQRLFTSSLATYILSCEAGFLGPLIFPQIPPFLFFNAGAVLALWLMRDIGWPFALLLLTVYPTTMLGAKGDGMISYTKENTWCTLAFVFLGVKNGVADLLFRFVFRPDFKWGKQNEDARRKFHRKWTATFEKFSLIMLMIHVTMICSIFYTHRRLKFFPAWWGIIDSYAKSMTLASTT